MEIPTLAPGRTVTVTHRRTKVKGDRYTVTFSALPGQRFGPWNLGETISQVEFAADLSRLDARTLVFDAHVEGSATRVY